MITLTVLTDKPKSPFYDQLMGKVDDQLLHLQDAKGTFILEKITGTNLKYYINQVVEQPWNNHLLLAIFVYADKSSDSRTIYNVMKNINPRLTNIFESFHLSKIEEFDVGVHMYKYFTGNIYPDHSDNMDGAEKVV